MGKLTIQNITISKTLGIDCLEIRISFAQLKAFVDLNGLPPLSLVDGHFVGETSTKTIYNGLTKAQQDAVDEFLKKCVTACVNNSIGSSIIWTDIGDIWKV